MIRRSWTWLIHQLICHHGSARKTSLSMLVYMRTQVSALHYGSPTAPTVKGGSLTILITEVTEKSLSPALLIMGEKDYVLKFPGMEDYIRSRQAGKAFYAKLGN